MGLGKATGNIHTAEVGFEHDRVVILYTGSDEAHQTRSSKGSSCGRAKQTGKSD